MVNGLTVTANCFFFFVFFFATHAAVSSAGAHCANVLKNTIRQGHSTDSYVEENT